MRILISLESTCVPVNKTLLRKTLRKAAKLHNFKGNISVAVVGDKRISELNEKFLQKRAATDVLAFNYGEEPPAIAGEIIASAETARRVAGEFAEIPGRELLRYCVHGMLHLCGYKDKYPRERSEMEKVQESLLPGREVFQK